jgi:hypothetical protein
MFGERIVRERDCSPFIRVIAVCFLLLSTVAVSIFSGKSTHASPLMTTSEPSISLSFPQDVFLSGSPSDFPMTKDVSLSVSTDASNGYKIYLKASDENTCLRHTTKSSTLCALVPSSLKISSISGPGANPGDPGVADIPVNNWGIGLTDDMHVRRWFGIPEESLLLPLTINSSPGPVSNDNTTYSIGVNTDSNISPGVYAGEVILTAVANPIPAPTISRIVPDYGPQGTEVIITGTGFESTYLIELLLPSDGLNPEVV